MAARILSPRTLACSHPPVLDFLAPRTTTACTWTAPSRLRRRHQSTAAHHTARNPHAPTPSSASASNLNPPSNNATVSSTPPKTSKPIHELTPDQRAFLASALRVNQTGELAAILIYAAQSPLLVRSHPHLRPLMKHMYDQEAGHYKFFNEVISKHRIRPTAMTPVWTAAASVLGWGTAFLGREAAMACTEAVETE